MRSTDKRGWERVKHWPEAQRTKASGKAEEFPESGHSSGVSWEDQQYLKSKIPEMEIMGFVAGTQGQEYRNARGRPKQDEKQDLCKKDQKIERTEVFKWILKYP